ncbi:c-type cytochrome domain-containing protein [Luteolibacter sp. AS25]|uniref:c-type cytochrome domain-containing protein n=1 Tax=Luteolibacter sp. AS25 TaxID=3135776 RepID=UPI00398B2905
MTTEADLETKPKGRLLAFFLTICGILAIGALIAAPFITGEPDGENRPDLVRFLGHFHPVALHLPIGIFILILAQEFIAFITRKKVPLGLFPVFLGALSAISAVVLGFLLYHGGGFEGSELVEDHLWGGIIFGCFAVLTLIVKSWCMTPGSSQLLYRVLLLASVGVMSYASHDGASITHGKDYLTQYAPDPLRKLLGLPPKEVEEEKPAIPLEEKVVFTDLILPIFEMRCIECHKESKAKGKLRMDTYEMLIEGGKEGSAIEPGDALDSNIIFRAELPADDEEHMPPEGKTDIEDHELAIVKWWIDQGASPTIRVGELELPEEIHTAIEKLDFAPPVEKTTPAEDLDKLISSFESEFPAAITPDEKDPSKLSFSGVSMRNTLTDEKFGKLSHVIPHLISVDLSATAITPESLSLLQEAKDLRTLRLAETDVDDSWVDALLELRGLETLNLSGTEITAAGVEKLSELPDLKTLYLWETTIPDEEISRLRSTLPEIEIVSEL